jgi:hypothetical protein
MTTRTQISTLSWTIEAAKRTQSNTRKRSTSDVSLPRSLPEGSVSFRVVKPLRPSARACRHRSGPQVGLLDRVEESGRH